MRRWSGVGLPATRVVLSGGSTGLVAYGYDGWDRRVRRSLTRSGVTTTTGYLHAGDHLVATVDIRLCPLVSASLSPYPSYPLGGSCG